MAYEVEIEKVGHKDGGPKIIAVFREEELGYASTMEISVGKDTTDETVLTAVKGQLQYLIDRDAAFAAITVGVVDAK
jgi:hypothetical protein